MRIRFSSACVVVVDLHSLDRGFSSFHEAPIMLDCVYVIRWRHIDTRRLEGSSKYLLIGQPYVKNSLQTYSKATRLHRMRAHN